MTSPAIYVPFVWPGSCGSVFVRELGTYPELCGIKHYYTQEQALEKVKTANRRVDRLARRLKALQAGNKQEWCLGTGAVHPLGPLEKAGWAGGEQDNQVQADQLSGTGAVQREAG